MSPNIFSFPFVENRPKILTVTCFISLLVHGLLLAALGLAIPHKTAMRPEDKGISIDLAAIEPPIQPAKAASAPPQNAPAASQKAEAPQPEPAPQKAKTPKPMPKKTARPPKSAPEKTQASKNMASGNGAKTMPAEGKQLASKAPMGETRPPAPGANTPRPAYPELARKRGQEGTVNVRCQVDANGNVVGVALAKSSGFKLLDEAALKTVGKWKFKPGKKDGSNVAGTVVVPVQFRLQ